MKRILLFIFWVSISYLMQAQTVLYINGANTIQPTLYIKGGLDIYVNGGITVDQAGSSGAATNNYIQNNGVIHIQQSTQSDFSNNVTGLKTFTTGETTGEVVFDASQTQSVTGSGSAEFMNLTVTNASVPAVNLSQDVTVDGVLNIGGVINVQSNNLTLLSSGSLAGSPFSATNMIQADGTGQFILGVNSGAGSFLFPVGDGTPTYSPVNLIFSANTDAGTIGLNVKPVAHPQINNPSTATDYLNRYWTFSNAGLTNYSYTGSFNYVSTDIVGVESKMELSRWANPWYQQSTSLAAANTLTIGASLDQTIAPLTGDFTARNPVCVTSAGTVTATSDSVCAGNSQILVTTGNTDVVQWQSSVTGNDYENILSADSATYLSQPSQTTYYRTFAVSGGCSDTSLAFKLTVNPLPDLPQLTPTSSTICSSDSAMVCAAGNYSSYLWNTTETTSCIEAKSAGDYWVTVSSSSGCSNISNHTAISVYSVPSVSVIERGDTLLSFGAVSYQWYFNGNKIDGATSGILIVNQSGNYSVQITDGNGCNASSSNIPVSITGIPNLDLSSIEIYPNPTGSGFFNILCKGGDANTHLSMFNMLGEKLNEKILDFSNAEIIPIDVSGLPKGVYLLQLNLYQQILTQKVVIQ